MKTETKNRIASYKRALPRMKERVVAAGFAALLAATIAVSATFAWVTLSRAPEVSAVATTLAANGALEIALSKADGSEPSDADFDESLGLSTDVTITNLQWGNLINISDPRYGIDDLELRPAQLNTGSLTTSPLWGAVYGVDGRVEKLNSKYTYAAWDNSKNVFLASDNKGVRAISSYTIAALEVGGEEYADFEARYSKVLNAHTDVGATYYAGMTGSIGGLGNVMSTYLQSKLNEKGYGTGDKNIALTTAQLQAVCSTHDALYTAMNKECDALVALANLQQYIFAKQNGADGKDLPYTEVTWDKLRQNQEKYDSNGSQHKTGAAVTTPEDAISLTSLKQFIKDYNTATTDNTILKSLVDKSNGGTTVYSNEIDAPVNHLVNPGTCKIDGKTVQEWMAGSKLDLLSLKSGDHLVTLCDGLLKHFEQIASDNRLPASKTTSVNAAPVSAKASYSGLNISINMTGHLCTDASGASDFQKDFGKLPTELSQANKIAEDTYGMAIDFWIRSNHESTYLTLEGATTTDTDGKILSYDGKNRIWGATGNLALTTDSTTQGGGSCYVYYADTPEDMQRSLDLMEFMKVAFVSQDGILLAKAEMDTQNYLAVNGRVTVPLVISQTDSEKYTAKIDENTEETRYAIKHMKLDEKTLITAIIYIDGENLQNTEVLSAASIQGQLNLQFSSSENMTTVGDNKLLTAERYVTASVSKNNFDYDADEDLTTEITVNVEGSNPDTVEAFFVRAVNNSQGQRCETITFEKNADGSWKGNYAFPLPGVYYLRYIRLDRVDYALSDPCRVDVNGFAVSSVNWSEGPVNEKEYYSTENSYAESVSITFASTEGSRMPTSVQARFIRDDGNAVTIDTKYNAASKAWEGVGIFTASGNYTLSYLILNGNYYDIGQFTKQLNLHMGLKATVYNKNSSLFDEFDSATPNRVWEKNIQVSIIDSSGQSLAELSGLKIYYASGSSGANSVDADLTWGLNEKDESGQSIWTDTGYYEGTLPLVNAGRYRFYQLMVDASNTITKVTEAPVYTIVPPDAPEYDPSSASTYNGERVNFIPLKANATMGPIRISDSAAAQIAAVVYNSETGEYYDISKADVQSKSGTMYYTNEDGGYWKINLPTYEKDGIAIQDGTWQLVCLKLWDCFDGTANEDNYRNESHPMIWLGKTAEAASYAATEDLTVDQTLDFSKLTTTVSCTVNVDMDEGTTKLGSRDAAFMTQHKVSELGMKVTITDDAGRSIPADKLGSVELNVNYAANTAKNYGYEVSTTGNKDYAISMVQQSDGSWQPDSQANVAWQYVGEYQVNNLSVRVGEKTQRFAAGKNGVPEKYTVTSQAPTAANLEIKSAKLDQTEFGKSNGAVTGAFLAAYSPKVTVEMTFSPLDVNKQMYAVVPGMSVTVDYQYQDGTSVPNGGYSWTGVTGYENHRDTCDNPDVSAEKYSFTAMSSKTLLAGRYSVTGTLHWTEDGKEQTKSVGNLGSINVWSVQPTVTVTGLSYDDNFADDSDLVNVTVNKNGDGDQSYLNANADTFTATSHYGSNYAVGYMQYTPYDETNNLGTDGNGHTMSTYSRAYAHYTAPKVRLLAEGIGVGEHTLHLENGDQEIAISQGSVQSAVIGKVSSYDRTHTEVYDQGLFGAEEKANFTYKADRAYILGTRIVSAVDSTVPTSMGDVVFTRQLSVPITLSQTNKEAPVLRYSAPAGMSISVNRNDTGAGVASGSMVEGLTELTVVVRSQQGYHTPRLKKPAGVMAWTQVSASETEASYTLSMTFDDLILEAEVQKYPEVVFNSNDKAAVQVRAGETVITSGAGVKPGTKVTVTATAKSDAGYCQPRIAAGSGWTKNEGDYVSTYTFTMPNAAVTIAAPICGTMYRVSWENTESLTITAVDHNENDRTVNSDVNTVSGDDYVIPGHTVIVTVTADGGTNPSLTQPAGAVPYGSTESAFIRQYSITMPRQDVTIVATSAPYPLLSFENTFADVTLKSNGAVVSTDGVTSKGIKPENTVTITLTAKPGYYAPRMTAPDGVTEFRTVGTPDNKSATYSFKMPNAAVNVAAKITATEAKTITLTETGAALSLSAQNYDGTNVASGSGVKVQPGQTVTVYATVKSGYFNPTVSGGGATEESRTGYDKAVYTFTMGTSNITLVGGGTQNKQITVTDSGTITTIDKGDSGVRVYPGTKVTVTVSADDEHYNPGSSASADGITLSAPVKSDYTNTAKTYHTKVQYTFTMGENDVVLASSATKNPKVAIKCTTHSTLGGTDYPIINDQDYESSRDYYTFRPGVSLVVKPFYRCSSNKKIEIVQGGKQIYSASGNNAHTFTMNDQEVSISVYSEALCVASGTMITMADGTQKAIENVNAGDMVMTWSLENGRYEAMPVAIKFYHGDEVYRVLSLRFANGIVVKTINEHGFFDLSRNTYSYINESNYSEFVGHEFVVYSQDGSIETTELVGADVKNEYTGSYSLQTAYNDNFITEGVLSITAEDHEGRFEFFEVGEGMKYDSVKKQADIEKYGLYTYSEFSDLLTEEQFYAFNGPYFKVLVGRGVLTRDDIETMIQVNLNQSTVADDALNNDSASFKLPTIRDLAFSAEYCSLR